MKALEDLFLRELAELYDAERQIVKALPKMAKATERSELRAAFETHYKQTERHVDRLEKIFKALGREPESQSSDPISEIVKQGDAIASSKQAEPSVLDAALITAAQKVEHYEIALYGSARSHAKMLGYLKIASLLEDTLREEEETDALLTKIAERRVNVDAAKAPFARARVAPRAGEEMGGWGPGALVAGILIGAAVALLYAPKSGEKMRRDLRDTADDLRARSEGWRETAEDLIERGRKTINEQRERLSRV
ncbi:MAG TPA: DUF892 family protein [Bryobacteraceae bacterium]|nr:DUF892 family protein [Bryobacteraceae bacterium]